MPPIGQTKRPHLKPSEAASTLKVSIQRVKQLLKEGRLKGTLAGGVWMIDPASVDDYAKSPRKGGFPFGRHRTGGRIGGGKMLD